MKVCIKVLEGGRIPEYKTCGSVGADCFARIKEDIILYPNARAKIPLGFAVEIPEGYEMQIRGRSGLSVKGIECSLGTIDNDYRGEVCAILSNKGRELFEIKNGDRIVQAIVASVEKIDFDKIDVLGDTERNLNGFGSTGIRE